MTKVERDTAVNRVITYTLSLNHSTYKIFTLVSNIFCYIAVVNMRGSLLDCSPANMVSMTDLEFKYFAESVKLSDVISLG